MRVLSAIEFKLLVKLSLKLWQSVKLPKNTYLGGQQLKITSFEHHCQWCSRIVNFNCYPPKQVLFILSYELISMFVYCVIGNMYLYIIHFITLHPPSRCDCQIVLVIFYQRHCYLITSKSYLYYCAFMVELRKS